MHTLIAHLGLILLSLVILFLVGRKTIWPGFFLASLFMGFTTLDPHTFRDVIIRTFGDPTILLLALAVGIIPLLGAILEESGVMNAFISQLRMPRRLFAGLSPALLGCLPMPGGALLSAPLIERGIPDHPARDKAVINVWFRHVLVLVYPLGTLLATSKMASVSLYGAFLATVPFFIVMAIAGIFTLLQGIPGRMPGTEPYTFRTIFTVLGVIFIAPIIHVTLSILFPRVPSELLLTLAVLTALILALRLTAMKSRRFRQVFFKATPWRYALLILGVFLFMFTFQATGITVLAAKVPLSRTGLFVGVGAILGFLTGRVNLPVALIIPLAAGHPEWPAMNCVDFAIMHFAIFTGYVISPVHPCIIVSMEYFKTDYLKALARFAAPTIISFLTVLLAALLWWG